MIEYKKHRLDNGLRVLVHSDTSTPMVAVNTLYNVGARDERPDKTGFAHLFEHLMFEGSIHVPRFDYALQRAGGENNAFTTNDITNYYLSLPAQNLETAFWLESDRMLGLDFSEQKLETQKNVVVEEYKQSYLNQPYGDAWLLIRPLAYEVHPYRWATIGKSIDHIKDATLPDVKDFFAAFYNPSNAILTVAGNVEASDVFELAEKWFGDIDSPPAYRRKLPEEPGQSGAKRKTVTRDVPQSQIYIVFHMCGRGHPDFHTTDLLSDILSNGESARLPARLVHEQRMFSDINAYISGNLDPGLFVITGKPHNHTDIEKAEEVLWKEALGLVNNVVDQRELQKVKNKVEATHTFSESNLLAKAMNLAYYELQGDAGIYNRQIEAYAKVTADDIQRVASGLFRQENSATLRYLRNTHMPS